MSALRNLPSRCGVPCLLQNQALYGSLRATVKAWDVSELRICMPCLLVMLCHGIKGELGILLSSKCVCHESCQHFVVTSQQQLG